MKDYSKAFKFYRHLGDFLCNENYLEREAIRLVTIFDEINDNEKRELTIVKLREFFNQAAEGSTPIFPSVLVEWCFEDLAPYLRDPEPRAIVADFISRCTEEPEYEAFVHLRNIRFLNPRKSEDGPVAITVIVDNFNKFKEILKGRHLSLIETIHLSRKDRAIDLVDTGVTDT